MSITTILVVDDSVVYRTLLRDVLDAQSGMEVVGVANNGKAAVVEAARLQPDVIVLDVEMPQLDGISALKQILAANPDQRAVMYSAYTTKAAQLTLEALSAGASGFAAKPLSGTPQENAASVERELVSLIRSLAQEVPRETAQAADIKRGGKDLSVLAATKREAIGIAVSTGGPVALKEVLPELPADFPLPVLIVQHMPPVFTKQLAESLNKACAIEVVEAEQGMPVLPGRAYIAPGDYHMEVQRTGGTPQIVLHQGPRENSCRPAADPLFRSMAACWGNAVVAVIMTGMGSDGAMGAELLRQQGAAVLAQDLPSSVVWGMPGTIVERGLADAILPLSELADAIIALASAQRG